MSSRTLVDLGHIQKAPKGKTEIMGKFSHEITTKPDNITYFKMYGRLHIQFCISLRNLFPNSRKHKHIWILSQF